MSIHDEIPNVNLPDYNKDGIIIERFEIDEQSASMSRFSYGGRYVEAGTYTRLKVDGALWMSDTRAEKLDHLAPVRAANGDCLITGLGLAMVVQAMAEKDYVQTVTVIERDARVIEAVAPHLSPKVDVIHADALEWTPPRGQKWDVIWHDIWQSISLDDADTRARLSRKFSQRFRAYHGQWAKPEFERLRRESWEQRARVW